MDHTDTPTSILKENSDFENFTTLNYTQIKVVWDIIRALDSSKHPMRVLHAFELSILNTNQYNGKIMLTRNQFAQKIGCSPNNVGRVMNTLVDIGIITRERKPVTVIKGLGLVNYFINKNYI